MNKYVKTNIIFNHFGKTNFVSKHELKKKFVFSKYYYKNNNIL